MQTPCRKAPDDVRIRNVMDGWIWHYIQYIVKDHTSVFQITCCSMWSVTVKEMVSCVTFVFQCFIFNISPLNLKHQTIIWAPKRIYKKKMKQITWETKRVSLFSSHYPPHLSSDPNERKQTSNCSIIWLPTVVKTKWLNEYIWYINNISVKVTIHVQNEEIRLSLLVLSGSWYICYGRIQETCPKSMSAFFYVFIWLRSSC